MSSMRQGKCTTCNIRWTWEYHLVPVSRAYCPRCGNRLQATTHISHLLCLPAYEPRHLATLVEVLGKTGG